MSNDNPTSQGADLQGRLDALSGLLDSPHVDAQRQGLELSRVPQPEQAALEGAVLKRLDMGRRFLALKERLRATKGCGWMMEEIAGSSDEDLYDLLRRVSLLGTGCDSGWDGIALEFQRRVLFAALLSLLGRQQPRAVLGALIDALIEKRPMLPAAARVRFDAELPGLAADIDDVLNVRGREYRVQIRALTRDEAAQLRAEAMRCRTRALPSPPHHGV